jgi:hypothetical protein
MLFPEFQGLVPQQVIHLASHLAYRKNLVTDATVAHFQPAQIAPHLPESMFSSYDADTIAFAHTHALIA